jgi:acyl-CoA synthetase (AMP-forming)/AMP-acid ligase II
MSETGSVLSGGGGRRRSLAVLIKAGVLGGGRPDRTARRLGALVRFGPTLAGSFAAAAARDPGRTAVIDERRRISYAELNARVGRIAAGLAELGVGPTGSIAVLQRNSAYVVEALVATARLGADTVLLNTGLSPTQLAEVLQREQPVAISVDAELLGSLPALPESVTVIIADPGDGPVADQSGRQQAGPDRPGPGRPSLDQLAECTSEEPAVPKVRGRFIVLTSGTTGAPKGAKRGAPKGLGPAASMLSRIDLKAGETMFIAPPLFHTWGLGMLQLASALSSTIVLRRRSDPEIVLAALAEHGCTSLIVVPVMAQRLLELPELVRRGFDTSSLRVVACSSAAVSKDLSTRFQDAFGDVLYNIYGATEFSWATIATPEDLRRSPGTAGRPPYGTRLALLDEDGKPVPLGQIGGVHVGNEMIFEGYTNGSDKSWTDGLISTGDRGLIDEHGLLSILGRDDDMVISGGENVYPSAVEELLTAHPQVLEVAVIGVPDPALGQRLAAYLVLQPDAQLSADDVRALVRARLATFCVPRDVVFLDALPRNATGKVVPRLLPRSDRQDR